MSIFFSDAELISSPDGKFIVMNNPSLNVFDVIDFDSGELLNRIPKAYNYVPYFTFSPDGRIFAIVDGNSVARLYAIKS